MPTALYTVLVLFVGLPMLICLALRACVATALKPLCDYAGGISYSPYAIQYPILIAVAYLLGQATALVWIAPVLADVAVAATIVEYGYDPRLQRVVRSHLKSSA